jgi:adenylate cyclase
MTATRRLAAILAADGVGYSRLIGADEEGTLNRLKAIRTELIDPKISEHRGRIVKTTGDGILIEFANVVDALRCATEWQHGMAEHNTVVPSDPRMEFRIGVHQGDVVVEDGDSIIPCPPSGRPSDAYHARASECETPLRVAAARNERSLGGMSQR